MNACLFIKPLDEKLTELGLGWAVAVIDILLIFLLARICVALTGKLLRSISARYKKRLGDDDHAFRRTETALTLINGLAKYAFYFIAIALAIGELGLGSAMASMLAAAGIGTLAIGLGAQSIISDVAAGLFIIFEDQIAVGDYVILAGVEGYVDEVSLRTITIRGFNGERHIIPNGQIKEVTNFSRTDYIAFFDMEVSRDADADRALDIMMEEAERIYQASDDPAKKPPERLGIAAMAGNSMTLRIIIHCSAVRQWATLRAVRYACNRRFHEEGITAPEVLNRILTDKE
ncbi:MAG: mechanosensitive ion channel family protein [Clostridia bacterium]|nr:mechanosensitive ion channel family protein [Clostridia bacterium]